MKLWFLKSIKRVRPISRINRRVARRQAPLLGLERLEDRTAPAGIAIGPGFITLNTELGENAQIDIQVYDDTADGYSKYYINDATGSIGIANFSSNSTWSYNGTGGAVYGTDAGIAPLSVNIYMQDGNDTVTVPQMQTFLGGANFFQIGKTGAGTLAVTLGAGGSLPSFNTPLFVSGNSMATTSLTLDDSADTVGRNLTVYGSEITGLASAAINYSNLSSVNVLCGKGNDNVALQGTYFPLAVNGGGGNDNVTVGTTLAGLYNVTAPVSISNPGGQTNLAVDGKGSSTPSASVNITSDSIIGLTPAAISYVPDDLSALTLTGPDNSTYYVDGTPSSAVRAVTTVLYTGAGDSVYVRDTAGTGGAQLTIDNGAGNDYVYIQDSANTVEGIDGFVNVSSGVLAINDFGDTNPRIVTLDGSEIDGLSPAPIAYSTLTSLQVQGSSGGDVFTIPNTPSDLFSAVPTTLFDRGADQVFVQNTSGRSGASLAIQTLANNVPLSVSLGNPFNGVQGIAGAVSIQANFNNPLTLNVDDSADTTARTATIGTSAIAHLAPATITFSGMVTALSIKGGSGGNTFTVLNTLAGITTALDTGAGDDSVTVGAVAAQSTLLIDTQDGSDYVTIGTATTNGLESVQGLVNLVQTVTGPAKARVNLLLNDVGGPMEANILDNFTLTSSSITGEVGGISFGGVDFSEVAFSGISINAPTQSDSFLIASAPKNTAIDLTGGPEASNAVIVENLSGDDLTINGNGGPTSVNIGILNAGNLEAVQGLITLQNTHAAMSLDLNDSADPVPQTYIVDKLGIAMPIAGLTVEYFSANLSALTIEGGPGGNLFTFKDDPASTTLSAGAGNDTVTVQSASAALTIDAQGGSNDVALGNSGSLAGLTAPVTVSNSGFGSTALTVDDSADTTGRNLAVTTTSVSGLPLASLSFSNVAQLDLLLGSGTNSVDVSSFIGNGSLHGSGGDTLNATAAASFTLSDNLFSRRGTAGSASLAVMGFDNAVLTATGPGIHTIDATAFSGTTTLVNSSDPPAAITAVAATATATVGTGFSPLAALVTDARGNPLPGAAVSFAILPGSSAGGAFTGSATVTTNAQGIAVAPVLTANTTAGTFTVTAQSGAHSTSFTMTNQPGASAVISVAGGNGQNTIVGAAFPDLLQATVTDAHGNPVAGAPVMFAAPTSGPSGSFAALPLVLTNAQGIATAPALVANHLSGNFLATATATGVSTPATFALVNTPAPAALAVTAGNLQFATVNAAFAQPLQVKVTDAGGQPIPGITIDFIPEPGSSGAGGSFAGTTAVSDVNGLATASALTANTKAGKFTVEAWVTGLGAPAVFTLTNIPGTAAAVVATHGTPQSAGAGKAYATALQAMVVDAFNNPISSVKVTFTVVPNAGAGASFSGKTSVTATTNSNGLATAPTLKANTKTGSFTVTAMVAGGSAPATFNLTNTTVAAAHIRAVGFASQSPALARAYGTPLTVEVTDLRGKPISGVIVTFTVEPQGTGTSFNGQLRATASTASNGQATAPPLQPGGVKARFKVIATAAGLDMRVTFDLSDG
jgi:hypothetical protein